MKAMFKILGMPNEGERAYIHASPVKRQPFVVSSGSTLGGVPLKNELNQNAAENFTFRLERPTDLTQFKIGQIVELVS
jgi:hypothetical protein